MTSHQSPSASDAEPHAGMAAERPPAERDELERLVVRASTRDGAAWATLIERYGRRIYALIRSRLHDPHLAEEVTQSVIVTVFESLTTGKYEASGSFEPWLFRITMNRVRDHVRRRSRRPSFAGAELMSRAPAAETNEEDPGDIGSLRSAIEQLPEADREILSLRHQAGMEFRSIAEMTGEPVGTLLARHHRAVAKLRQMLAEGDQDGTES